MADTEFVTGTTITSEWLNDINDFVYHETIPPSKLDPIPASKLEQIPASKVDYNTERTVLEKLGDVVSVKDFGAVGDGVADDLLAFQRAQDSLGAEGGEIFVPPGVYLFKGTYPAALARVQDGVKLRSNVTYRGVKGATEIRLDPSCICGFTTRLLTALTDVSQAPTNISFYGITFTRPNSVWDNATENTGLLEIGAVNGLSVQHCSFIGWPGDAILLGANNNATLSAVLQTYIQTVDISYNYFDGVTKDNRQAISLLCGVDINIHHNTITRTTRSVAPAMPGAIDVEPILTTAEVANVRIIDNVFDDIGGATGVVSVALLGSLAYAAHDIIISNNVMRNISNTSDIYVIGKSAAGHTAVAVDSPYNIEIARNLFDAPAAGATCRRFYIGGVVGVCITNNIIREGGASALLGYDDGGASHFPVQGLVFSDNYIQDWKVNGDIYTAPITIFGGILAGDISDNVFIDSGNSSAGVPVRMTVLSIVGNGALSKNVAITNNVIINSGAFSASLSFPIYATTLTNPTTFEVHGNTFIGLSDFAYASTDSIYSQVKCDFYKGVKAIPSTASPVVSGVSVLLATTGDTFTSFTGGYDGQQITIIGTSGGAVIQNNANINLAASANFTLAADSTITLIRNASKWYEVCRSVN